MPTPRVSVITPTYNHEAFIGDCVQSVIDQSFGDWEMIIVDDGSTDRTGDVARGFSDPRVRYVHQENQGIQNLKNTYNKALEMAQGEVIGILEGDDYWPSDKLEVQVPDFDDPGVVLSSGLTRIVMPDGSESLTPPWKPEPEIANNRPVGRSALKMMNPDSLTYTFPVATMLRASALRGIGGFQQPDYLPLVDFPTFLSMTVEGEWRFHQHVLGCWRRHMSSVTSSRLSEILENAYRYTFEFIHANRDRLPLSDAELDEIERIWDATSVMRCLLRGRMLSEMGDRGRAASAFKQALLYRHARRVKLQVGLSSALTSVGLPVEFIYRMAGKEHWKPLVTLDTNDTVVSPKDMDRPRYVGRWRS